MNDSRNRVNGNVKLSTKYTFTNKEKLNAPISIAFTETNFMGFLLSVDFGVFFNIYNVYRVRLGLIF